MTPLDTSIITVNTNERERLVEYLPSVWSSLGNFEVLISDNGSTDGSLEYIEAHFPKTRIVRNGRNLGFAGANNRAAAVATSQILVFLNPDTTVHPRWLLELIDPFHDPKVGLTTSKILLMRDPRLLNTCGNNVHLSGLTLCNGMGQPRERFPIRQEVSAVSGAAFAIRRELFHELGGFNESFFIYMEDTTLSIEARLRGWKCVFNPKSVVYHDYSLRFGPNKILYQERNRYMMLLVVYRWPTLLLLLPALLSTEILTWGFVLLRDRKHWANKFKAYYGIWQNRRLIMAQRRNNQSQRQVTDRSLIEATTYALDFQQISTGSLGRISASIFNPVYWLFRTMTLSVIWW